MTDTNASDIDTQENGTDTPTDLYVSCPACVSFASKDDREAAQETARSHNNSAHDGEDLARPLNARDTHELGAFIKAAKEHAPGDEYENLVRRMYNGNSPFFCPSSLFRATVPEEDQRLS